MDRNAFTESAIAEYSDMVLRLAFSYVRNTQDGEDIAQDVFFALMKSVNKFKEIDNSEYLKAWLIRVTINKSKNHLRSFWYAKRSEKTPAMDNINSTMQEKDHNDEHDKLLKAVLDLDEKYRIPLHLYYYQEYSVSEISRIMDIPQGTVLTRLRRARILLANKLGEGWTK